MQELNGCHTEKKCLSTLLLDRVLRKLTLFPKIKVYSTYSPVEGGWAPYFGRFIKKGNNFGKDFTTIIIPLCDGRHIHGFIVNLLSNEIIYVDSIPNKNRIHSTSEKLRELFFTERTDVKFSNFYTTQPQDDSHSCGAWLLGAMLMYVIGISPSLIDRDNLFIILKMFIKCSNLENLELLIKLFLDCPNTTTNAKRTITNEALPKISKNDSSVLFPDEKFLSSCES